MRNRQSGGGQASRAADVTSSANAANPRLRLARGLVMEHGWNATAYQIINPGIAHWFSAAGDAVVGYVPRHGVRVVAGAPVCSRERLADVATEFEEDALQAGQCVCYFGAEARLESLYHNDPEHSAILLGAQPAWHPRRWPGIVAAHASLRAQLNRARNKGIWVEEWTPERATGHPALEHCLSDWLESRGLPPLYFLVEPRTLERLFDRRIFVARGPSGVAGFLVASPVPQRNGWLVEQSIRCRNAPNGTAELMIDSAVRAMRANGSEYVTLGLAPLAYHTPEVQLRNPPTIRLLLAWVRAHGRRFYNFGGLDAFKSKFHPECWEPVFAIANEQRFGFGTLYAAAEAFCDGSPVWTILKGVKRQWKSIIRLEDLR